MRLRDSPLTRPKDNYNNLIGLGEPRLGMPQVHPYLSDKAYAKLLGAAQRARMDITVYAADVLYRHVGEVPKHNRPSR